MIIGRRPQPLFAKLAGVLNSGKPKSLKKYDLGGGVGLGIVAALERSELVSHHKPSKATFISRNQTRSNPVPTEMDHTEEDYTFVTCHGPNKTNISTKVYYDGVHQYGFKTRENVVFDKKSTVKNKEQCLFHISPVRTTDDLADLPETDFLSVCHLCRKNLHGKDIYMYRGDKAFCSTECRHVQIEKDERKEKPLIYGFASSRSSTTTADISITSPYNTTTNGLNFATGIFAT